MQQVFIQNLKARQKFNFVYNFSSKYHIEQTLLVTIIPPFAPTEGYSDSSQQCHRKFTSAVHRSLLMSPRFLMRIHSQSIDQVHSLEAC